ncbi:MAG: DUF2461 domain-containing protein, partial [Acidimicrobiales bacterium]
MAFTGFGNSFFGFFNELQSNNNRDWFNANKSRYENDVASPCLDFIEAMQGPLADISPHFRAIPKKIGGSMFRIYRDTRFSKDKTPYKTNAGLHFRHELGKDAHAPGFYLHLAQDDIFMGAGLWKPPAPALAQIREAIDKKPKEWMKAKTDPDFVKTIGELAEGNPLIRAPKGYDEDHPMIEDLKKRSFFMVTQGTRKQAARPDFVDQVTGVFKDTAPVVRFLTRAV